MDGSISVSVFVPSPGSPPWCGRASGSPCHWCTLASTGGSAAGAWSCAPPCPRTRAWAPGSCASPRRGCPPTPRSCACKKHGSANAYGSDACVTVGSSANQRARPARLCVTAKCTGVRKPQHRLNGRSYSSGLWRSREDTMLLAAGEEEGARVGAYALSSRWPPLPTTAQLSHILDSPLALTCGAAPHGMRNIPLPLASRAHAWRCDPAAAPATSAAPSLDSHTGWVHWGAMTHTSSHSPARSRRPRGTRRYPCSGRCGSRRASCSAA